MGAGMVGAQVARRLENHPEYGLAPIGFLDEDPRSVAEVGGRDVPDPGHARGSRRDRRSHRRAGT
jgi:FlaA1/EpsC-like NDP-sugar epimerase